MSVEDGPFDLPTRPAHLGLGATIAVQPTFTGQMEWYEAYGARTESDGVAQVTLQRGDAVINRPGIWHTADVTEPATALFITAGVGTEMRPR